MIVVIIAVASMPVTTTTSNDNGVALFATSFTGTGHEDDTDDDGEDVEKAEILHFRVAVEETDTGIRKRTALLYLIKCQSPVS